MFLRAGLDACQIALLAEEQQANKLWSERVKPLKMTRRRLQAYEDFCLKPFFSSMITHTFIQPFASSILHKQTFQPAKSHFRAVSQSSVVRSRFRDILPNLRVSGSRYQYADNSQNFQETWYVFIHP